MKLVRFATNDSSSKPGVMIDDAVVALSDLLPDAPIDMIGVIDRWEDIKGPLAKRVAERPVSPIRNATLLAPIRRPGKIMAIGLNYADHIEESGQERPAHQVWFSKASTAANGPFDPIQIPKVSPFVDYEAEMVVVIGAGGRHIARADAPKAVFGFCVG